MKCGIVTPIGPGHEKAYQSAVVSIEIAARKSQGPFDAIELFPVYDLKGELGRSKARNLGVESAHAAGCDWIFFLDADDLMFEEAFRSITDLVHAYDAIWGLICEAPHGRLDAVQLRPNQLPPTTSIHDLLKVDPFLSIQMGVFVRTAIALQNPFDEAMDTGEDFKFYLACWTKCRCVKGKFILFVNVRGNHSIGPRSADGVRWRESVARQIQETRNSLILSASTRAEGPDADMFNMFDIKIIYNQENESSFEAALECQRSFRVHGHNADLFNGVWRDDSQQFLDETGLRFNNFDERYARLDAVVGCFGSHYNLWRRMTRPTVILEHDARLDIPPVFEAFQNEFYQIFRDKVIVVNLGRPSYGNYAQQTKSGLYPLFSKGGGYFPGTHAYAISPGGAAHLVTHAMQHGALPADLFFNAKTFTFLAELWPWPIRCDDTFTSVQKIDGSLAKHNYNKDFQII